MNDAPRPELPDDVEGIRVLSSPRPDDGPRLAIIGAVHGNEPCGLTALDELAADHDRGEVALTRGQVVLIHGNPAASAIDRRGSAGGTDLNRLFDFRFLDELPRSEWRYEHHRAVALRPVLEACDVMLDIHSAGRPTPAFAIADDGPRALLLAELMGVDWIITRWTGEGAITERTSLGLFRRLRRPAVVVECGAHDGEQTLSRARTAVAHMLATLGLVDGAVAAPEERPTRVQVFGSLPKPDATFRFVRPFVGFDPLGEGEPVGGVGAGLRVAPEDCLLVLPNDDVPVGKDVAYFARRVSGDTPA